MEWRIQNCSMDTKFENLLKISTKLDSESVGGISAIYDRDRPMWLVD